jgi:hypothetical protein
MQRGQNEFLGGEFSGGFHGEGRGQAASFAVSPALVLENWTTESYMNPIEAKALARKARSEEILRAEGVPILDFLPVIETEDEVTIPDTMAIAQRALALGLVALKGEGLSQETTLKILADFKIDSHLSPAETAFILNPTPTEHDSIQFVWRYEAYWVLLWALGFVETLERPDTTCDCAVAVSFMRDLGPDGFRENAKLRPASELFDAADLIYRYHWAVRNAWLQKEPPPAGLEPGVVQERHYALNWLTGDADEPWDDVDTST